MTLFPEEAVQDQVEQEEAEQEEKEEEEEDHEETEEVKVCYRRLYAIKVFLPKILRTLVMSTLDNLCSANESVSSYQQIQITSQIQELAHSSNIENSRTCS